MKSTAGMPSDRDVAYASAASLLDLYRKRALSPVEATRLILDPLDGLQPKINAFCVVDRDGALDAAHESERRWLRAEHAVRQDYREQHCPRHARRRRRR